jgi:hypothetical protein
MQMLRIINLSGQQRQLFALTGADRAVGIEIETPAAFNAEPRGEDGDRRPRWRLRTRVDASADATD